MIPTYFQSAVSGGAALGAAVRAGLSALVSVFIWAVSEISSHSLHFANSLIPPNSGHIFEQLSSGGQILTFQRSHPSDLPERPKSEQEVVNTDKERTFFAPGSLKWSELAEECAEAGVAASTWLFPSQFSDVATIGKPGEYDAVF